MEPYKDEDGNYGVRISDDALSEYGWHRDEKTGQLKPNMLAFGGLTGGPGGLDGSSQTPWMHEHADGEICRDGSFQLRPETKPKGRNFNIIAVPGVLTDGNGHYYDAHDLPDGMSWDGKSKSPEVTEGYVVTPDGACMTDEAAREKYENNLTWEMQEDGTFINNLTGDTWKYSQKAADIKGCVEAMKGIDGRTPIEFPEHRIPLIEGEKDFGPVVGPSSGENKISEEWMAGLDQVDKTDWKNFGKTTIDGPARDKSLKTKLSEKKGLELPDVPTVKGASDGTEYGG